MNQDRIPEFIRLFNEFKGSESYKERKEQFAMTPIFRDIITEALRNEPFTNQHLTDLIQILKYNSTDANFDNKLAALVKDEGRRKEISDANYEVYKPGYTNAGKQAVNNLDKIQLRTVKKFLTSSFAIKSLQEAVLLCREFEAKKIPQVTRGVYSPWLYYINPQIFPIINNTHKNFKKWMGLMDDYPSSIEEYCTLNKLTGESELGELDNFAYHFTKDGKLSYRKYLYLDGNRIFKISHGKFLKQKSFRDEGILDILRKNNWIALHHGTGRNQGNEFRNDLKIGDYVYVCYGGESVLCIGRVTSDIKQFDTEMVKKLQDKYWIYREIQPLYFPVVSDIRDLKSFKSQTMPSGYSTFKEVGANDLDLTNEKLFIPKFNLEVFPDAKPEHKDNSTSNNNNKIRSMSLNTILFGPPGTGKTFHSISHAVAVIENVDVKEIIRQREANEKNSAGLTVKDRYNSYINKGFIKFCTFHQSMAYEDFIEGIKPVIDVPPGITEQSMVDRYAADSGELRYEIRDGIFKKLCKTAYQNYFGGDNFWNGASEIDPTAPLGGNPQPLLPTPPVVNLPGAVTTVDLDLAYKAFLDHLEAEFKRVNEQQQTGEYRLPAKYGGICIADIRKLKNVYAVIGARGPEEQTSTFENIQLLFIKELYRHYNVEQKMGAPRADFVRYTLAQRAKNDDTDLMAPIQLVLKEVASMVGRDQAYFSRPNVGYGLYRYYADFVAGFLTKEDSGVGGIADKRKDSGTMPPIFESPTKQKSDKNSIQPYVLIIDEINRGNVSQIFGELITLIEEDKRLDKPEAIIAELPYSLSKFGVPSNVYIIGTMNTADRSVEALDTALRRRFTFVPMMPEESKLTVRPDGIDLAKMLAKLNERLRILKDNDHTIGHAWLMGVNDLKGLREVFGEKILPLLQEYFYNNYEKLGLVLGDQFFDLPHTRVNSSEFATFTGSSGLSAQYKNKWQHRLKKADDLDVAAFTSLYQTLASDAQQ
jgi:hypothetical protein